MSRVKFSWPQAMSRSLEQDAAKPAAQSVTVPGQFSVPGLTRFGPLCLDAANQKQQDSLDSPAVASCLKVEAFYIHSFCTTVMLALRNKEAPNYFRTTIEKKQRCKPFKWEIFSFFELRAKGNVIRRSSLWMACVGFASTPGPLHSFNFPVPRRTSGVRLWNAEWLSPEDATSRGQPEKW